ncbi:MAG: hypothetical protein WA718_16055 [Terriglobales bacterium]
MSIGQGLLGFDIAPPVAWRDDWGWGAPLIILTVVIHVLGLGLVNRKAVEFFDRRIHHSYPTAQFALVISAVTVLATALHAAEAGAWALCFLFLGARPDFKSAMLYSLGAMTTYGSGLLLEQQWRLLGAIEALSGWLLFGMTTAFLFGTIQKCYQIIGLEKPSHSHARRED